MRACILPVARAAFRRVLAIATAALLLPLAPPAFAEPAMWVVKDEDSTIYLLGTFHMMKPGTRWRSDKIEAAFESSDELWLEAVEAGQSESLRLLLLTHGLDPAHPLSAKLDAEQLAVLDEAAEAAGLPAAHLDPMRPWLAALTLALAPLRKHGYEATEGVDKSLEASAEATHKRIKAFETAEQQILFLAGMSEESELAFLSQTLQEVAASPEYVDRMMEMWMAGNVAQLDAMVMKPMKSAAPELYDTIFVRRNLNWSDQIATVMKGAGTSFIAVGTGHLTGDRSLQAILEERGFKVSPY